MKNWRIIEKAKVVQDTSDPCTTGILINGKVYPLSGGSGGYLLKPSLEEITFDGAAITLTTDCDSMVQAIENGAAVTILIPAGFGGMSSMPAFTMTVVTFRVYIETLQATCMMGDSIMEVTFVNAPIPSFLQE